MKYCARKFCGLALPDEKDFLLYRTGFSVHALTSIPNFREWKYLALKRDIGSPNRMLASVTFLMKLPAIRILRWPGHTDNAKKKYL